MVVRFNMIDGSELYVKNVISIDDVGRDLRITFKFEVYEPGTISEMYLQKVGELRDKHFINCVRSYEIQHGSNWRDLEERECILVDYHFYVFDKGWNKAKHYTRYGCADYISPFYKAFKSGDTHCKMGGETNDDKR